MFNIDPLEDYQPYVAFGGVFSPDELARIRKKIEGRATRPGTVGNQEVIPEIRDSGVIFLKAEDDENLWIFDRIKNIVSFCNPKAFGLDLDRIENLQLTEYDSAREGHYGQHMDSEYGKSESRTRKLSITVQLSDPEEYEGGDLMLYPHSFANGDTSPKAKGMIVVFRSHIVHEVTPVTKGKRYSLVAWVHGPLPR